MVAERVHLFAEQVAWMIVPEQARASRIAKSAVALEIDTVNGFSGGIEQ
jgi:hypothetical protein